MAKNKELIPNISKATNEQLEEMINAVCNEQARREEKALENLLPKKLAKPDLTNLFGELEGYLLSVIQNRENDWDEFTDVIACEALFAFYGQDVNKWIADALAGKIKKG